MCEPPVDHPVYHSWQPVRTASGWVDHWSNEPAMFCDIVRVITRAFLEHARLNFACLSTVGNTAPGQFPANPKHLHNICATSDQRTLVQRCTNVIQMVCVCWASFYFLPYVFVSSPFCKDYRVKSTLILIHVRLQLTLK